MRKSVAQHDIAAVARLLLIRNSSAVAAECANVILNLCFEQANINELLMCNGVAPLVTLLRNNDDEVQANACGVIQSICCLVCFHCEGDAALLIECMHVMR
jgi:exonuclease I